MSNAYRAVLGPTFGAFRSAPVEPPKQGERADVEITVKEVDEVNWRLLIGVPAYSLDTHNDLVAVRAYLVPSGHGVPDSAQGYLDSSYACSELETAGFTEGVSEWLELPDADEGAYLGQTVLLFDDGPLVPVPEDPSEPTEPTEEPATQAEGEAVPTTG